MMKKSLLCVLCICCLLAGTGAMAEEAAPALLDKGLTLGGGSVAYPEVTGMADAALEQTVNDRLLASGDIENRLNRLALLISSPVGLKVSWQGGITGDILSVVYSAEGAVTDDRPTHVWNAVNLDLRTGADVTFADLFADESAARAAMEELLQYTIAPDMSAHLQNSELTPLPEQFGIDAAGLTLYYPIAQLSTLSDRAGAVTLRWYELRNLLKTEDGSVLDRIGAQAMITLDKSSAQQIRDAAATGRLPGIPLTVGDPVQDAVDRLRLLADPDLYEDGRMLQLEGSACRGAYLLTDSLHEDFSQSVIQGVRADNINLFGLCTGETTQRQWRDVLGEPDATVTLDADKADAYRLPQGQSDYYQAGDFRLRLHADTEGTLVSISVTK